MHWLYGTQIDTDRLVLEPLEPRHATEMVAVLAAPELYAFIGGEPPSVDTLRARYQRQTVGHSPAHDAGWLNWIIKVTATGDAVGYVQATLTEENAVLVADVAWLVTPASQHGGIATEAAAAMLVWLLDRQVMSFRAFINPEHHASIHVARRLGLTLTSVVIEGESLWERHGPAS